MADDSAMCAFDSADEVPAFSRRLLGASVELPVFGVVSTFGENFGKAASADIDAHSLGTWIGAVFFLVAVEMIVLATGRRHRTFGMYFLSLEIVHARHGGPPTRTQLLLRSILKWLFVESIIGIILFLTAFENTKGQGLHERLSITKTVRLRSSTSRGAIDWSRLFFAQDGPVRILLALLVMVNVNHWIDPYLTIIPGDADHSFAAKHLWLVIGPLTVLAGLWSMTVGAYVWAREALAPALDGASWKVCFANHSFRRTFVVAGAAAGLLLVSGGAITYLIYNFFITTFTEFFIGQ